MAKIFNDAEDAARWRYSMILIGASRHREEVVSMELFLLKSIRTLISNEESAKERWGQ